VAATVGRGRLEAHAKEDDLVPGILPGDLQGIDRGIDHLDPRAFGLGHLQAPPTRPGHAHQIAEGGQDDTGTVRGFEEGGHFALVGYADRASRAGDMDDLRRQHGSQATLEDGDGVGAADLHEPEGAGEFIGEAADERLAELGVVESLI
jgi:hypothetical protein